MLEKIRRASMMTSMPFLSDRDYITECLAGMPVDCFGMHLGETAPLIFLMHGRGGYRQHMHEQCRRFASEGFAALCVDQRNHGPRTIDPLCNQTNRPAVDMYGVIVGTAMDATLLADLVPASLGIGKGRLGIAGTSLGGHVAHMALGLSDRFDAAVNIIGSGNYAQLMRLRAPRINIEESAFADFYPPELDAMVRRMDPISHPERFSDRPLLMLNGADDDLVQPECNRHFFEAALPHYAHPERLRLVEIPGVKHETTPAMWDMTREWFRRWLFC